MLHKLSPRAALVFMVLVALLVAHPVVWSARLVDPDGRRVDSFPLSTYPMFANRPPAVQNINYVIVRGGEAHGNRVPSWMWARGGMNQARGQINRAVGDMRRGEGRERLESLCDRAAARVAKRQERDDKRFAGAKTVAVVRSRYDVAAYFEGKARGHEVGPQSTRTMYWCPIPQREDDDA